MAWLHATQRVSIIQCLWVKVSVSPKLCFDRHKEMSRNVGEEDNLKSINWRNHLGRRSVIKPKTHLAKFVSQPVVQEVPVVQAPVQILNLI